MKSLCAAIAVLVFCGNALAAGVAPAMPGEVVALFSDLEHSGCQFNRNGTWYNGTDARAHLQKKYDYLLDKGKIATTEEFIEKGATGSSMSGQDYQVKCPGDAQALPSAQWLRTELLKLRRTPLKSP